MTPESAAMRERTIAAVIEFVRFALMATCGLAILLLLADFVGRGWNNADVRYLSERALTAIVSALAAEVVAAIVAVACLTLWKS